MIHRRPARRTSGGCERKGSGWQGGQGGRGRAATRCGGRAATHLHRGPTAGPSKSHRTLCVALEILLRQGSTRPSSASVTQNFALKQRETDGNNSASVNLRHCVSKTENVEWPLQAPRLLSKFVIALCNNKVLLQYGRAAVLKAAVCLRNLVQVTKCPERCSRLPSAPLPRPSARACARSRFPMRPHISLALLCPSQVDVDDFIYLGI